MSGLRHNSGSAAGNRLSRGAFLQNTAFAKCSYFSNQGQHHLSARSPKTVLPVSSFVPRNALVGQKALVGSAVHQGTAFVTAHAVSGCFDHCDFVFRSAVAFVRSGEPFYEFGHARNMRSESVGCQPAGLLQSN
jgi:hypothetical protein